MTNYIYNHTKGLIVASMLALLALLVSAPMVLSAEQKQKCQARLSDDPAEAEIPCEDTMPKQGETETKTDTA